jgi:hypothetical protein
VNCEYNSTTSPEFDANTIIGTILSSRCRFRLTRDHYIGDWLALSLSWGSSALQSETSKSQNWNWIKIDVDTTIGTGLMSSLMQYNTTPIHTSTGSGCECSWGSIKSILIVGKRWSLNRTALVLYSQDRIEYNRVGEIEYRYCENSCRVDSMATPWHKTTRQKWVVIQRGILLSCILSCRIVELLTRNECWSCGRASLFCCCCLLARSLVAGHTWRLTTAKPPII